MKPRLSKYDPAVQEKQELGLAIHNHVIIECCNVEFDNLLEIGIVKRYNVNDMFRLKVAK